jgi:DNA recombination protein RmuC
VGEELYGRLATFSEHLAKLGRGLDGAVENYNRSVGSFEAKVLPSARKFAEMGISGSKNPEEPQQIEKGVRVLERE